jgi:serine/threonine protein kinase
LQIRTLHIKRPPQVAIKFYLADPQSVDQEQRIMSECGCLNIAPQLIMRGTICFESSFRRDTMCHIEILVMELQSKTLAQQFEEFEEHGNSSMVKLQHAMLAAQSAIELLFRLHSKFVIHRDIKPENLMYNVRNAFC